MTRTAFELATCRPLLPTFEMLRPFLEEIDAHRWYSNFGPLTRRFEMQLAQRLCAADDSVVTVANATAGITLALREATKGVAGLCVMPAWTFVATPLAACNAGLTPYFVDVEPGSWQIDPDRVRDLASALPGQIRAVVPVAPFGAAVDVEAWARLRRATGIEVVIDAAAAFDTVASHEEIVSVVSLHATKVLGVGDGGFIVAGTAARADRLRRASNFGLNADRHSIMPGQNAKMSEYAAAVGLAALARWSATRSGWIETAAALHKRLSHLGGLAPRSTKGFASATFNVVGDKPVAGALLACLRACSVEARKWWADACHRHPIFANAPRSDLSVTEHLVDRVVALPFSVDMSAREMDIVVTAIERFAVSNPAAER